MILFLTSSTTVSKLMLSKECNGWNQKRPLEAAGKVIASNRRIGSCLLSGSDTKMKA